MQLLSKITSRLELVVAGLDPGCDVAKLPNPLRFPVEEQLVYVDHLELSTILLISVDASEKKIITRNFFGFFEYTRIFFIPNFTKQKIFKSNQILSRIIQSELEYSIDVLFVKKEFCVIVILSNTITMNVRFVRISSEFGRIVEKKLHFN